MKQNSLILCAIACAALGFVLGSSFFDGGIRPPSTYGKRWLLVTGLVSTAFVIGLASEYLLGKLFKPSPEPKTAPAVDNLRQAVERRFRGDRTDKEYQRAEAGVAILVAISTLVAMLLMIGIWVVAAVAIVYCMTMLVELYMSFKKAGRSPRAKIGGALFSGIFYGLLFGYFMGPP
ncbi:hypothetical protein [Agrobacterium rosae]